MSTILNTNGDTLTIPHIEDIDRLRVSIFTAEWNPEVTHALRDGAVATLREAGMSDSQICLFDVPGSVELANAAASAMEFSTHNPVDEAIIVIGCVIRGDTPHFDYVCQIAADATSALNAKGKQPVIFGVLTVENQQQALDRAGGCLGNKGCEAAVAALKMIALRRTLQSLK